MNVEMSHLEEAVDGTCTLVDCGLLGTASYLMIMMTINNLE